jgi:hypothetical protein
METAGGNLCWGTIIKNLESENVLVVEVNEKFLNYC